MLSPLAAYWTTDILSDAGAREYIFGRGGSLELPFPTAVKTGTSQAYHDNWTIGYTRDVTVGVWVGNFDRTPLRDSTGVSGAGPIFQAVMLAATRRLRGSQQHVTDEPILARPDGLAPRDVCALSGMDARPWCPSRHREWLPESHDAGCDWHHETEDGVETVWPAEYRQWAASRGLLHTRSAAGPPGGPGSTPAKRPAHVRPVSSRKEPALSIVNPPAGATYLIDPTLRREFQTLALRATGASGATLDWKVNGQPVGRRAADATLHWPLAPGTHRITVQDERGRTAEATVRVR